MFQLLTLHKKFESTLVCLLYFTVISQDWRFPCWFFADISVGNSNRL